MQVFFVFLMYCFSGSIIDILKSVEGYSSLLFVYQNGLRIFGFFCGVKIVFDEQFIEDPQLFLINISDSKIVACKIKSNKIKFTRQEININNRLILKES